MSSLLAAPSSTCCSRPCPSPLQFSSRSSSLSPRLVSFPSLETRRRCRLKASRAFESDGFAFAGDSKVPSGTLPKSRREILLEYVKNVQPEFMELFIKRAPQQVVDSMQQTVTNMIGTLPPQFFAVTVTTVAENLAQLMYSVMMTGYMFKNAPYRLELQQSLEQVSLPDVQDKKELTSTAGEDVVFALNTFIKRLLAVSDPAQMKTTATEASAPELAKLLHWLMMVGYSIRNIEVRFDMERVLGAPAKLAELPPAENV